MLAKEGRNVNDLDSGGFCGQCLSIHIRQAVRGLFITNCLRENRETEQ